MMGIHGNIGFLNKNDNYFRDVPIGFCSPDQTFSVDRSEMIETMVERLAMGWGKEFYQTILGLGCYKKLIKVEYCDLLYITRPGQGFDSAGSRTHGKAGLALCRSSEASMGRGRRELAEVSQR